MLTKRQQCINAFNAGDYKTALRIASKFNRDLDAQQHRTISIAYESMAGKSNFYEQLGIDTKTITSSAIDIIKNVYIDTSK